MLINLPHINNWRDFYVDLQRTPQISKMEKILPKNWQNPQMPAISGSPCIPIIFSRGVSPMLFFCPWLLHISFKNWKHFYVNLQRNWKKHEKLQKSIFCDLLILAHLIKYSQPRMTTVPSCLVILQNFDPTQKIFPRGFLKLHIYFWLSL